MSKNKYATKFWAFILAILIIASMVAGCTQKTETINPEMKAVLLKKLN